jgi:hypothetical protein
LASFLANLKKPQSYVVGVFLSSWWQFVTYQVEYQRPTKKGRETDRYFTHTIFHRFIYCG